MTSRASVIESVHARCETTPHARPYPPSMSAGVSCHPTYDNTGNSPRPNELRRVSHHCPPPPLVAGARTICCFWSRNRKFVDSPLEEGVSSEPVSEVQNSLLAGKIQGNSLILASSVQISGRKHVLGQMLTVKIPYATEQGINCALAGN
jgi:hypothetical protein